MDKLFEPHPPYDLRPPHVSQQSGEAEKDDVARELLRVTGLPGWLRPVTRLTWSVPHTSRSECEDALERLSPRFIPGENDSIGGTEEIMD